MSVSLGHDARGKADRHAKNNTEPVHSSLDIVLWSGVNIESPSRATDDHHAVGVGSAEIDDDAAVDNRKHEE